MLELLLFKILINSHPIFYDFQFTIKLSPKPNLAELSPLLGRALDENSPRNYVS